MAAGLSGTGRQCALCAALRIWALLVPALVLWAASMMPAPTLAADAEFDAATGYRIARYRAPVPENVDGGTRISAADVSDLVKTRKAVLIDVMPSDGIGADPASGHWRSFKPRQNIPGSHWLPDVGAGTLTEAMDTYFRTTLARLTGGETARALIIYCQADCWMSWNAVRRASRYGYSQIYWFAEGSDGWRDWDGQFSEAVPVPLEPGETR